jgi:predicted PurR-regulated permease PerM
LWQLLYFGVCLAAVALVELVVVVLLLSLFLCLFAEPLLTALLQTKRLQPSSAIGIVLTLFLLMMMVIVYGMLLSFLSSSFSSSVCCFCRYCCYYGIMHLSIVVEIIHHISHWSANTMNKRISMIERIRQKEGGKLVAQCKLL